MKIDIFIAVHLVERNTAPNGYELLNAYSVGRHNTFDLVSLASEIQNADIALNNQSGKLTLILDQARTFFYYYYLIIGPSEPLYLFILSDSFFTITSESNIA